MKKFLATCLIIAVVAVIGLFGIYSSPRADAGSGAQYPWFLSVKNNLLNAGGSWVSPATLASATTLTLTDRVTFFNITGTANCTRIVPPTYFTGIPSGAARIIVLRHTSTDTLTDGVNLKLAGNFNGTADDILALAYNFTGNDTFWTELYRSAN